MALDERRDDDADLDFDTAVLGPALDDAKPGDGDAGGGRNRVGSRGRSRGLGQGTGLFSRRRSPGLQPPAEVQREQRRPRRLILGLLVLVLCGALGWGAWARVSTSETVVVAAKTIERGKIITRGQLGTAQVNEDSGLPVVPAAQLNSLVGQRAATDIPVGSIVPAGSTTTGPAITDAQALVGVLIKPGGAPVTGLAAGARVRLVALAQAQGQDTAASGSSDPGSLPTTSGLVVRVGTLADGSGTSVDVAVDRALAVDMQRLAAAGRVAVIVDSER